MNEIKKNDFFATLVKNQDLSLSDLRDNGITVENSSLLSRDEYKSMPQVKEAFKDSDGNFDEKKFDIMYNNAKELYTNYASEELLGNVMENFTYSPDAWFVPQNATFRQDNPIVITNRKPSDISQGISYITSAGLGNTQELSIREQAQREKVVNFETGEELDYSPNDKAGLFTRFSLPTLVIAQYDEDGTHVEDGITVSHKAGDLKLNKNGRPYYETLGNREIYNKDVLRNSDILTVDGSKWNKIDIFDSDDVHKSAGKVALSLVAKIAPMFCPYGIGEIYGYLGAADGLARVLPVLGKAVNGLITGNNDNAFGQAMSSWEGYASRFDSTQSDYAREHMFSLEGIGNMISDVSKQLFQQRAISTIPAIYAKARNITDYKKVADVSKGLSLAYMAATSAQDVYGDFKSAGASDRMAGLGMIGSTLALYKLMSIDYFRDNLFKDTFMDESEVREALKGASKETRVKFADILAKEGVTATPKEAAKFVDKVSNFYHNTLVSGLQKTGFSGLMNRGLSEGTEEVMEEVTTDLIKGVTEGLNALGIPVTEKGSNLDFGWSARDFAQRYGTSFVGGFIGGQVFALQGKYQKMLDSKLFGMPKMNATDMQKLVYMVATGKRAEIDSYLDTWHNKGLLGSKELSVDGETKLNADGTSSFIPNTKGVNENDAVYNTIKNTLDYIQNAVEAEVPNAASVLTAEGLDQLRSFGYNDAEIMNNPKLLTASAISALGDYSSFEHDLFDTLTKIVEKKAEIEKKVKTLSDTKATTEEERKVQAQNIKDNQEVKKLQDELKDLRETKDKLLKGEKNKYYSGQAFFAANQDLQAPFVNISKENYTKLTRGLNYDSLSDDVKKEVDSEYKIYINNEGRNQVYRAFDLYLNLSKQYAPIIQEYGERLDKISQNKKPASILGISDFIKAKEEYDNLKKEKLSIEKIDEESRTEENKSRLSEINSKLVELSKSVAVMLKNPQLAAITPGEDKSTIDIFTGAANPETAKIRIHDDYSAGLEEAETSTVVDTELATSILDSIRSDYQRDASEGNFRFDDNELLAFYSGIASSYRRTGGAGVRMQNYFLDIENGKLKPDNYLEYNGDEGFVLSESLGERLEKEGTGSWFQGTSTYRKDIQREADNIIKNIGINNKAAQASFNNIIKILEEHTNLTKPENKEYLDDFLRYIIPTINGKYLISREGEYSIVNEFDSLREKISYSPFLEIMGKLGTDVKDLNLLQLVQQETMNLSTASTLEDYLIQNSNIKNSLGGENFIRTIGIARAVIRGTFDGTNTTMNNFRADDKDDSIGTLATMSENAGKTLVAQSNNLVERIAFLGQLSDWNNSKSLKIHKATAINMRPKWIKSLFGINESFIKVFDIDLKKLWDEVTNGATLEPTEENFAEWESNVINFEQVLHNEISVDATSEEEVRELADKLVSLFDAKTLYKSGNTKLTDDKDAKIGALDLVYHLAQIASLPSTKFYSAYKASLSSYNEKNPNNPIVPVYGQEYATKQIIAQALNPALFNNVLDKICDAADFTSYEKHVEKYLSAKSRLHNLGVVLGGAGAGKTMGVIKTTLSTITGSASTSIAFIAGETEQAQKVAASAGFDSNYWTVDEYCEKTFGSKVSNYIYADNDKEIDNNNGHWKAESSTSYTGNGEIFNSEGIKILVIDEIETLTEPELVRICNDAEKRGILVIGAGDLKQPGKIVAGKNLAGSKTSKTSGLEDCEFVRTPTLTTSMRPQTIAKVENTKLLSNALETVLDATQSDPSIDLKKRASLVTDALKKTELYYWEDTSTGELSGDMGVDDQTNFEDKIKSLSALDGTVAIITDKVQKYTQYKSDKISIVPYEKRAGGEWDYVLVDVDFAEHDSTDGINAYLLTQDFYTLTQRSRKGTVIKTSDATSMFTFTPDETKQQSITPSTKQFVEFNEWRMESLSEIDVDETALNDNFGNTPLTEGYDGEAPKKYEEESKPIQAETQEQQAQITPGGVAEPAPQSSTEVPTSNIGGETEPSSTEVQQSKREVVPQETKPKETKPKGPSKNITKLFLSGPNSISGGLNLTHAIADTFSSLKSDINKAIRKYKDSIGTAEEFALNNSNLKREIRDIIRVKYGDPGVELLDTIINNYSGFEKTEGEKVLNAVNHLIPLPAKLSDHGKARVRHKNSNGEWTPINLDGDVHGLNKDLFNLLEDSTFYKWARDLKEESLDSFHSIEKLNLHLSTNSSNNEVVYVIKTLGSYVRTGNYNSSKIKNILRNLNQNASADFIDFIGGDTKLWIVPYKNKALLISRHYSKDGRFFDVPVLSLDNTPSYGEFKGTIEVYDQFSMEKTPDEYITIDQLKTLDPNIKVNSNFGVFKVSDDEMKNGLDDVDEISSEWKQKNNGKVFTAITDEVATSDKFFNSSDNLGIYKTDFDNEKLVLGFGQYALTGCQCRVTLDEFLGALKNYRAKVGLAKEFDWMDYTKYRYKTSKDASKANTELSETASSDAISDISLLKTDKGKYRQLLPWKRAGQLLSIAALNIDSVSFALHSFMRAIDPEKGAMHTLVLPYSVDGKKTTYIEIALVDNEYRVGSYNGKKPFNISEDSKLKELRVSGERGANGNTGRINLEAIFNALYGEDWKQNPPAIHLKNYYISKDGKSSYQEFSYNWELATMLASVTGDKVGVLEKALSETKAVHGIFLDDHAKYDTTSPDTHWGILEVGNRIYETDHTKIKSFTHYVVNLNNENIIPSNPNPIVDLTQDVQPIVKPSLQSFIDSNHLGIKSETVSEANMMLETAKDWRSQYIEETENGFELKIHGDENFENWFNHNFKQYDDLNYNILLNDFLEAKPNEYVLSSQDFIITIINGEYRIKEINQEIFIDIDRFYDILPHDYVINKFFGTNYNQKNILDLIQSNLEIAQKIAIFEDIITNELGC